MKNEIVAKKYGRNLVVVIDGVKKTRVISTDKDKKDEELIKNKVALYNKKSSKTLLDEILYLVDVTKRENDALEAKKKGIKKSIKKEVKKKDVNNLKRSTSDLIKEIEMQNLTKEDTIALEKLLQKGKVNKEQTSTAPTTTSTPRKKEY